jgi:hypothetical protein
MRVAAGVIKQKLVSLKLDSDQGQALLSPLPHTSSIIKLRISRAVLPAS